MTSILRPEGKLKEFESIFHPRSIAIAGVSKDKGKVGTMMLHNFLAAGFKGSIYPVNPAGGSIQGLRIYPNIRTIQEPIDYVIVAVPAAHLLGLLDDCAAKGVKAIQIFTAGFSESSKEEGRRIEEEMVSKARSAGIRIIGPNCAGISCPASRIPVPTTGRLGNPGSIAFLSQSGGHMETLADIGYVKEIRFSKLTSFGNGSDLNELDFLSHLAVDPETKVIGVYLEDSKNARQTFHLIKSIAKSKPVVFLKGGETVVGGETAASHTGSLAGSHFIWEAALNQAGAVRVTTLEELADALLAFQNMPPLTGTRAAIVSQLGGGAGGVAVSASDVCTWNGLHIPHPSERTQNRLRSVIRGPGTILRNPFDFGMAGRSPNVLKKVLQIIDDDSNVDFIMLNERIEFLLLFASMDEINVLNDVLIDFSSKSRKPLIVVSNPAWAVGQRMSVERRLSESRIPVYPSFERAARAMANLLKYWRSKGSVLDKK